MDDTFAPLLMSTVFQCAPFEPDKYAVLNLFAFEDELGFVTGIVVVAARFGSTCQGQMNSLTHGPFLPHAPFEQQAF